MRVIFGLRIAGLFAASISSAYAGEWCGFLDKDGSRVRCGFSSLDECKQTIGDKKDAYCMPDPNFAARERAKVRLAVTRF
jgi:hypothetical protein